LPLDDKDKTKTQTITDFRTAFLQRLANPLVAWNPEPDDPEFGIASGNNLFLQGPPVNPYITVDWGTID